MATAPTPTGQRPLTAGNSAYDSAAFLVSQLLSQVATAMPAVVKSVTTSGGVAPVGFVSAQPMVNQVDGVGNATPHGIINNIPYLRYQGGSSAIILDPVVGDIGLLVFASRDISAVKSTGAQSNPGSRRRFDWADALYIGGFLATAPTQYVQFAAAGVNIVSTGTISLSAGGHTLVVGSGGITLDGIIFGTHQHSGVEEGSGDTGAPVG